MTVVRPLIVLVISFLLLPNLSKAGSSCEIGSSDRLELLDWSAEAAPTGPYVKFKIRSNLLKAIASVSAKLLFENEAGDLLVEMPLSSDIKVAPGAEKVEQDRILDPRANDSLSRDGVRAKVCTRYVVYFDGGSEEF